MTQTLFIGLDGATFHILDDLTADVPGRGVVMPFLKRFMENGFRAKLRSTPNPLTPPAWTSMVTGRNPGAHGVYDFMRYEDTGNEMLFTLYDFRDIRTETVWSIASRQDKKVVSLNFPMMAPPPKINGSLMPGFTSWKHLRRNSTPGDLFDRLKAAYPEFNPKELAWDFDRENEIGQEMEEEHLARWIRYHLPREEQWYRVASTLLSEDRPDFMAVMFDGTDKIQHQAWAYIDPDLTPETPSAGYQELRDLCMDYFRRLDGYIEQLVEQAGPDTQVFMASDHGFDTTTDVVRINRFLSEKGYLVYREAGEDEASQRRAASPFAYLDWNKTLAFCPTPSSNGICIRVAKQPGDPGIAPEEYADFRQRLIADLETFVDPENGERIITKIMPREEFFPGEAMEAAPDLTLTLRDNGFVSIRNLEPALVKRNYPAGTHHPDGIFLAGGPGVRKNVNGELLQIADVAACFLYSLGLPVPENFEGVVPLAAFTEEQLSSKPVQPGPATLPVNNGEVVQAEVDQEEKDKILEQLAMLGYLEE
jgi:predicted AlkP superfamily phosphohydrolase/phosphomutase